jgi:hypothetical protein
MKKALLFLFAIALSVSVMAQTPLKQQSQNLKHVSMTKTTPQAEYKTFMPEANPFVSNVKAPDIVIGSTRYDLQSNSSMMRRVHAYPDGTIAGTWTRGTAEPSFPERGTGINYYSAGAWGPNPTARIEPVRTGWPNYAPYGENGEIVCAHTGGTAGLIFSWRENKGTGVWNNFYLTGPVGHEDLLWPRMITTGEFNDIIHVIAVAPSTANGGSPYEGLDGALLYSRSFDGGQTWSPQNAVLEGMSSEFVYGVGGDEYAWAAPYGETIAFVWGGFLTDGVVMKSEDNGDTWERMLYYEAPLPRFNNEVPLTIHGGIDSYQAAVIDDQGRVHVAAGRMMHAADGSGGPTNYYPYSNGLLYWNETLPPMDSVIVTSNILDPSGMPSQYLLAEVVDNGVDSIVGVATYQASLTSMPQLAFDYESNILYAFYSGLTLGFDNTEFNYRHIWFRFSEDYGQTWSEPADLTGDIFHIFSECVFSSVASHISDKAHLIYQTDNSPGINQRFEGHGVVDNNIVYLPVNSVVGINEKPAASLNIEHVFPNPASNEASILVSVNSPSVVTLSLVNMLGQEVMSKQSALNYSGTHHLRFNVEQIESGIYFVKVSSGNKVSTSKIMVR